MSIHPYSYVTKIFALTFFSVTFVLRTARNENCHLQITWKKILRYWTNVMKGISTAGNLSPQVSILFRNTVDESILSNIQYSQLHIFKN